MKTKIGGGLQAVEPSEDAARGPPNIKCQMPKPKSQIPHLQAVQRSLMPKGVGAGGIWLATSVSRAMENMGPRAVQQVASLECRTQP